MGTAVTFLVGRTCSHRGKSLGVCDGIVPLSVKCACTCAGDEAYVTLVHCFVVERGGGGGETCGVRVVWCTKRDVTSMTVPKQDICDRAHTTPQKTFLHCGVCYAKYISVGKLSEKDDGFNE